MRASEYVSHSPEETVNIGRELARSLPPSSLVLLRGNLGAGKTTLVKGIAEGFRAADAAEVTSPTFTLVHEYRGPETTVYHVDLYRIETEKELATVGIDDLLSSGGVVLIEWGDKFPRFEEERDVEISITREGELRSIRVDYSPSKERAAL